ncbi:unnamed protein product [Bubo scandiacus]
MPIPRHRRGLRKAACSSSAYTYTLEFPPRTRDPPALPPPPPSSSRRFLFLPPPAPPPPRSRLVAITLSVRENNTAPGSPRRPRLHRLPARRLGSRARLCPDRRSPPSTRPFRRGGAAHRHGGAHRRRPGGQAGSAPAAPGSAADTRIYCNSLPPPAPRRSAFPKSGPRHRGGRTDGAERGPATAAATSRRLTAARHSRPRFPPPPPPLLTGPPAANERPQRPAAGRGRSPSAGAATPRRPRSRPAPGQGRRRGNTLPAGRGGAGRCCACAPRERPTALPRPRTEREPTAGGRSRRGTRPRSCADTPARDPAAKPGFDNCVYLCPQMTAASIFPSGKLQAPDQHI